MPDTTPNPPANAAQQTRIRRLILGIGSLVVLAMVYGSGMRQSTRKLRVLENTLKVARQDARSAQLALQAREAQLQQLEARRQLALALSALDARNYGIASERVAEAARRLQTAESVGAATTADTGTLSRTLTSFQIPAGANLEQPRSALLDAAKELDAALRKVVPEPTALTPVTVPPPTANDVPNYEIGR
jgi:hypothetical protein